MEPLTLSSIIENELKAGIFSSDEEAIKRFSVLISEKISKNKKSSKLDIKMLIEVVKQGFEDINKKFDMMFKFMSLGFSIITILIVVFKFIK